MEQTQAKPLDFNSTPVQDMYNLCVAFEILKGIDSGDFQADLYNQMKIVMSEVQEMESGIKEKDNVEILDGAVDSLVTVFGMLNLLSKNGYDVVTAMQRVAYNNLSKFTTSKEIALETAKKLSESKPKLAFRVEERDGRPFGSEMLYVVLDSNDKVCKPVNFVPVNLQDLVPTQIEAD